ncbi:MAG: NAD-dependent epimerase/dehydratase family protein [Candidatus Babeliaceae bacterium]
MSNEAFFYDKPVLVTGGAGFIGSHLVEALIARGARVTILDDLSTGNLQNIEPLKNKITFIRGSITDYQTCLQATQKQSLIFHCAALVSVPQSIGNPLLCSAINVTGTFWLLEAARLNKVERFIFSSSSAVYGQYAEPCQESMACNPLSPYGYSKLLGEIYCEQYARIHGLKTLCLRYFNVYGPRQKADGPYASFYAKILRNLAENQPIIIYGDGSQIRDFIAVSSIIEANLTLAQLPGHLLNGQPINVAQGKSVSLIDLVTRLKKDFPAYRHPLSFQPARLGDIPSSQADCTQLHNFFARMNQSVTEI